MPHTYYDAFNPEFYKNRHGLTNYGANKLLDYVLRGQTVNQTWYAGLLKGFGGLVGGGQPTEELTHTDYFRTSDVTWPDDANKDVDCIWTFGQLNRVIDKEPWLDIVGVALFDAATGGNCYWWSGFGSYPNYVYTPKLVRNVYVFHTSIAMNL